MYNYYGDMHDMRQAPCPGQIYIIQAGDTLYRIAARYGITVGEILAVNPGLDPNRLFIGQRICIPVIACPGGQIYTIVAGDTLYSIAVRFNVTVNAILAANPGLDPNRLFIGQRICIPGGGPVTCPGGQIYTIKAGDTLYAIAQRFNVTVAAILTANPGLNPNALYVGQQICIPTPPVDTCPNGQIYVIKAGDTVNKLAQQFQVSVKAILEANPGLNPNAMSIGQKICIPNRPDLNCPGGRIYVIKPGDNLYVIARRFNVSLDALVAANPQLPDPANLTVGTNICIPGAREE